MNGFISELSILFQWSKYLSLCQYDTVSYLFAVVLSCILKSGSVDASSFILFAQIPLVIQSFVVTYEF